MKFDEFETFEFKREEFIVKYKKGMWKKRAIGMVTFES